MELISVVVPCYNEEESLPLFYDEIKRVSAEMKENNELSFEYIFVDDGSKDKTLSILREMAKKDNEVRYVSFSRNFGKEAAMYAGLEATKGDYVVILDADLQHPPKLIPDMYSYVKSGECDCAATRRISRKGEPKLLSFFSNQFYNVINKISQTYIVNGAQDFRFMKRQMVDAILSMSEYNRFSKGIFSWVGFKTKFIEVENTERVAGTTKWNFFKLLRYSFEGILAFSTAPIEFPVFAGIFSCFSAFVLLIILLLDIFLWHTGWTQTLTLLTVLLFAVGIVLISLGIMGQYISKTYMEVKKRPIYIKAEDETSQR